MTNEDTSGERAPWGVWTFDVDGMSKTETPRWWGWKADWAKAYRSASNLVATGAVSNGLSSPNDSDAYREGYRAGYRDGWRDGRDDE